MKNSIELFRSDLTGLMIIVGRTVMGPKVISAHRLCGRADNLKPDRLSADMAGRGVAEVVSGLHKCRGARSRKNAPSDEP